MIKIIDLNDIENSINNYFPNLENKSVIITLLSSDLVEDNELAIEIIKLSQDFISGDIIHLFPKISFDTYQWKILHSKGIIPIDPSRTINIIPTTI